MLSVRWCMKTLMFILIAVVLLGCGETKYITKTETILVTPPDYLLLECKYALPPEKQAYLEASYMDKERLLTEFGIEQTKSLKNCNSDKRSLRQWKQEQENIYRKKETKP